MLSLYALPSLPRSLCGDTEPSYWSGHETPPGTALTVSLQTGRNLADPFDPGTECVTMVDHALVSMAKALFIVKLTISNLAYLTSHLRLLSWVRF